MLERLQALPAEPILKLITEYRNDPREEKIDLGVGVYRNEEGNTPIFRAVKKAERWLLDSQSSKSYLGSRGDTQFCDAIEHMIFDDAGRDGIYTLQTPAGSGALRVAADVTLRAKSDTAIWISEPTWDNHVPLLSGAGLATHRYPYYDIKEREICIDKMLSALEKATSGDLVLLHACCHNPSGLDLSIENWQTVVEFLVERDLIPLVDFAYHGLANGIDDDTFPVRLIQEKASEYFVAYSCSKNFGMYRDRVGSLSFFCEGADTATIDSQAQNVVRTMYSIPPDHGSAVVKHILTDQALRAEWLAELDGMRNRMKDMRTSLAAALSIAVREYDWSHVSRSNGMFCYLGLSVEQVARLKREFGVYLVDSSRINVCGITATNLQYLTESIAEVLE